MPSPKGVGVMYVLEDGDRLINTRKFKNSAFLTIAKALALL